LTHAKQACPDILVARPGAAAMRIGLKATELGKVHALLRGNPTLILDSCSVRAKCGGDLTGPSPPDRDKLGTKYNRAE